MFFITECTADLIFYHKHKMFVFLSYHITRKDQSKLFQVYIGWIVCTYLFVSRHDTYAITLLFYQIEPLKNGPFLVLPSSIARNSSAPNAKIIFGILWGNLEGRTIRARPSRPFLKSCQNGTFWSMHGIWIFFGQMTLFEVLLKCHSLTLSKKCLRLRPALSMCLSERINWIISTIPHRISKILFVYGSYDFLAMLEGKTGEGLFF